MIKFGLLTAILDGWTYEQAVDIAAEMGFCCLEVACWPAGKAERRYAGVSHIDAERVLEDDAYAAHVVDYAAAKAGISNFTAFLATEVAKKFGEKIRVNAIAPGFFLTEQNRSLLTNPDGSWTQRGEDVIRQTPFGRMGEPEELCGTIHYLISDASKFVTGTVAVVDGGFNTFAM